MKYFTAEDLSNVMNLGMSLRQDQLNGWNSKSGNEILDEYVIKHGVELTSLSINDNEQK